jgi:ribonuclease HII
MKIIPKRRSSRKANNNQSCLFEKKYWKENKFICGVDEAGRGCMAGPVVIAAVILKQNTIHELLIDSKKLNPEQLVLMYNWLLDKCIFSVSIGSPRIIDQYNIYQTTAKQMRNALLHIFAKTTVPDLIAIDAMPIKLTNTPYSNIEIISMIQGESKSTSIAAASIIAKVTRDKIISRIANSFPGYGLAQHKGYCTKLHQKNTLTLKPTIIHRNSFLTRLIGDNLNEQQSII